MLSLQFSIITIHIYLYLSFTQNCPKVYVETTHQTHMWLMDTWIQNCGHEYAAYSEQPPLLWLLRQDFCGTWLTVCGPVHSKGVWCRDQGSVQACQGITCVQGHCHVETGKGLAQTVCTSSENIRECCSRKIFP